jgi:hypothetical protein
MRSLRALLAQRRAALETRSAAATEAVNPHALWRHVAMDGGAERKQQGRTASCSYLLS